MTDPIYMDYGASTPLDPRVHAVMDDCMRNDFGNAGARVHSFGMKAAAHIDLAREQVADCIAAPKDSIVFTSGATESNNMALFGVLDYLRSIGKTHIVTTAVEHKSVLGPMAEIEKRGFIVTYVQPKPCGMIEGDMIAAAITPQTGFVSVQGLNNEVGTIQPLAEIRAVLPAGIIFHSDAAQAVGKMNFTLDQCGHPDLVTLSSHKIYGPKGMGALYIAPHIRAHIKPLLLGSMYEGGMRAGTVATELCAGFGQAAELVHIELADDLTKMEALRTLFLKKLKGALPDLVINGHSDAAWRAANILNIRVPGIANEDLLAALPDLAFSPSSACNATSTGHISHVIRAMTGADQPARESIRLSFGRFTTEMEIVRAADMIINAVQTIQKMQGAA